MAEKIISSTPRSRVARPTPPAQLIGMTYDLAILACRREDADQSLQAILQLRDAMRSVSPGDSTDLVRFYDLCQARIRDGDFSIAALTLSTLRDAWEKAL
jgi:hypothetical protein